MKTLTDEEKIDRLKKAENHFVLTKQCLDQCTQFINETHAKLIPPFFVDGVQVGPGLFFPNNVDGLELLRTETDFTNKIRAGALLMIYQSAFFCYIFNDFSNSEGVSRLVKSMIKEDIRAKIEVMDWL